jgi:two-component system chemotaxis response regulator CheB
LSTVGAVPEANAHRDLVVIGASAGGVDALKVVVAGLPANLQATICIVLHIAPASPSALARILARSGPLHCRQAVDGDDLRLGEILVAAPDHHLEIEDNHARLTVGPRENGHRPAVDALFRSAAQARDGRVIGVVLSGNRDDGAAGLATIKAGGGVAIVQDPEEALYSGMPASAIANVTVDAVVPSDQIAATIAAMVNSDDPPPADEPSQPTDRIRGNRPLPVCPDCGGALTEESESGVLQWHCHVGHRYSPESLADAQAASVEAALWAAIRSLEERAALMERMAERCELRGQRRSARSFGGNAQDARRQAGVVRGALDQAAGNALRVLTEPEAAQDLDAEAAS